MTPLLLLCLLLPAPGAQEKKEPPPGLRITGQAGWGARTVPGEQTPVLVLVENRGPDRDLSLEILWAMQGMRQRGPNPGPNQLVGRTGPSHLVSLSVAMGTQKRVSLTLDAPDGDLYSVWVFARDVKTKKIVGRGELPTRFLESHEKLVAVVGADRPAGLSRSDVHVAWVQPDRLPEAWSGYVSLHALIWLDGRVSEIATPAQLEALRTWVSAGGHLVVARASSVGLTGTALEELLPVRLLEGREVERLTGLGAPPLSADPPDGRAPILSAEVRGGRALLRQGDTPLVVDGRKDAGRSTFVAFDPSREPFLRWPQADRFWAWILKLPASPAESADRRDLRPAPRIGSASLAQIATSFPDVAPPSIGGLLGLILLYLVVVGPLDYFLLRAFGRLEWTWFTFPAYVLIFSGLILLIGGAFIARAAYQREIIVEDHYPGTDFCRRRAIGAILAPTEIWYDVRAGEPYSSNLLAGNNFYRDPGDLKDVRIYHDAGGTARRWFLQRSATGVALSDRCTEEPSPLDFAIKSERNRRLEVTVQNLSDEAYEEGWLLTGNGVYYLDRMPPGEARFECSRTYASPAVFASREGDPASAIRRDQFTGSSGADEDQLRLEAERTLRGLTLGRTSGDVPAATVTGMSRDLDVTDWLEAGGTVLLVRRPDAPSPFDFSPAPSRRTAVALTRIFRGPSP